MAQVFAVVALAQFGNLYVDWTKKGEGGAPDDPDAPTPARATRPSAWMRR